MNISKTFLSSSSFYILNKNLLQQFGIEVSLLLSEFIKQEENNEIRAKRNDYIFNDLEKISHNTTLSKSKIKSSVNKLYKLKFIDVIVKKPEKLYVKVLHNNISNYFLKNTEKKLESEKTKKKQKIINHIKKFKKPSLIELKEYFLKLGEVDDSEIMYDFYESKGWKIGRNSMKCWKSATRNWVRRSKKDNLKLPNYYDKKFESEILNSKEKLSEYHNHLKKLGFHPSYSPTSGTTWKIKK